MLIKLRQFSLVNNRTDASMRCPSCRQLGTLDAVSDEVLYAHASGFYLGSRRCPERDCQNHVFVVFDPQGRLVVSYPPQRIDFDVRLIPTGIVKSLEEAITCHANGAFTAAAIMVRRTLEDLCEDKRAPGRITRQPASTNAEMDLTARRVSKLGILVHAVSDRQHGYLRWSRRRSVASCLGSLL